MNQKNLSQLAIFLSFVAAIFLSSCGNSPTKSNSSQQPDPNPVITQSFKMETDQTSFTISENNGKVIFGGDIAFTNASGYDISDLNMHQADVEISYSDGDSTNFDMMILSDKKKWINNSRTTITIGIDPFKHDIQYLTLDDFKRTPSKAYLKLSLTAINIDKEIPFQYQVDILPKWKEFQVKNGLR